MRLCGEAKLLVPAPVVVSGVVCRIWRRVETAGGGDASPLPNPRLETDLLLQLVDQMQRGSCDRLERVYSLPVYLSLGSRSHDFRNSDHKPQGRDCHQPILQVSAM